MKIIKGDLLKLFKEGYFNYIGHQCNMVIEAERCGGIARKIFSSYPDTASLHDFIIRTSTYKDFKDGIFGYNEKDNIINLYGQYFPGSPERDGEFNFRMEVLANIFSNLNKSLLKGRIGIPLIASGLAKYKKIDLSDKEYFNKYIKPIIELNAPDLDITAVVYEI